jgi:chromosome segregation ATPase
LTEKFEVEREILCLKIEKLAADNETLTSQHSDLESSLKQATTLIQNLEANLLEQKNEKFRSVMRGLQNSMSSDLTIRRRIEAKLTKDLDASSSLCSSLQEEKSKIEKELAVLLAQKEHTDHECKKLADQITVHNKERSVMQEDYEKKLQVQQELSASGEKELQGQLQLLREQIAAIKVCRLQCP